MRRHPPILALTRPSLLSCRAGDEHLRSSAASARRAAPPPPLLARSAAGEPRRHLCFAVRTFPGPLWRCFAVPPRAAAAVAARARARRAARVPWPRSRVGQGRWPCLDPAWWAAGPWAPPVGVWAGRLGVYLAIFVRFSLGFICLQTCKIPRNSCIAPKFMKLVLLDSSS